MSQLPADAQKKMMDHFQQVIAEEYGVKAMGKESDEELRKRLMYIGGPEVFKNRRPGDTLDDVAESYGLKRRAASRLMIGVDPAFQEPRLFVSARKWVKS